MMMMMMFIGTETLVTQLVNERSRVHANRIACNRTQKSTGTHYGGRDPAGSGERMAHRGFSSIHDTVA
jgi:hypothetical protein